MGVVGEGAALGREMPKRKGKPRDSKRREERAARAEARRNRHKGEYLSDADPDLRGLRRQVAKLGLQIVDVQGDGLVKGFPRLGMINI